MDRITKNIISGGAAALLAMSMSGALGMNYGCSRSHIAENPVPVAQFYDGDEARYWTADFDYDRSQELIVLHDTEQGSEMRLFDYDHDKQKHYDLGLLMEFPCDSGRVAPFIYDADESREGYDFRMGAVYPGENGVQARELDIHVLCRQPPDRLRQTVSPSREEMAEMPDNYVWTGHQGFVWLDFIPGGEGEQVSLYSDGRLILWENENAEGVNESFSDQIETERNPFQRLLVGRLDSSIVTVTGACINDDEYPDIVLIKDDLTAEVYYNNGQGVMAAENSEETLSLPEAPPISYIDLESCAESVTEDVIMQVYSGDYPGVLNRRVAYIARDFEENQEARNPISEIIGNIPFMRRNNPINSGYDIQEMDISENGVNDVVSMLLLKNCQDNGPYSIGVIVLAEEDGSYTEFWRQQTDINPGEQIWAGWCAGDFVENDNREDVAVVEINPNADTWSLQLYGNYESRFRKCLDVEVSSYSAFPSWQISTVLCEDFHASRANPASCGEAARGLLQSLNNDYSSDSESTLFHLGIGRRSIYFASQRGISNLIPFENPDEETE